jgi:uncharacterized DUF497 family protein
MAEDVFEWDDKKARSNLRKHGVSFSQAAEAFDDAFAWIEQDVSEDYAEDRFILISRALDGILCVIYTEREERIRIISARQATDYERKIYYRAAQKE